MNRINGSALGDLDHLGQSVADILTTPINSRVMRRDYGSHLFELVDAPFNPYTALLAKAAAVMALNRWEPRLKLSRINLAMGERPGSGVVELEGYNLASNVAFSLRVPLAFGSAS
ncbi:GPW/gp25 family protein [Pseudomonas mangiferae]|uniref:Baseplate assembly protein n=1 Tax=Pseudomonas mangiferae TaxID=2593654 RepID=A0A553H0K9_9PSED|nr:GPW/gp25 family protein [Pseudomonas mangiferae]TRX75274.1 baseplate assembly protein [Pseudomonas mangiferae]